MSGLAVALELLTDRSLQAEERLKAACFVWREEGEAKLQVLMEWICDEICSAYGKKSKSPPPPTSVRCQLWEFLSRLLEIWFHPSALEMCRKQQPVVGVVVGGARARARDSCLPITMHLVQHMTNVCCAAWRKGGGGDADAKAREQLAHAAGPHLCPGHDGTAPLHVVRCLQAVSRAKPLPPPFYRFELFVSLLEAVMKLLLTSLKKNSKKFGLHRHVCWDNPTDAEVSVPNQQDLEQEGGMELESDQRAPGLELGHVLDESLNVESGLEDSDGVGEAVLLTQECTVALVSLLKHYRHLQNSQGNQKKVFVLTCSRLLEHLLLLRWHLLLWNSKQAAGLGLGLGLDLDGLTASIGGVIGQLFGRDHLPEFTSAVGSQGGGGGGGGGEEGEGEEDEGEEEEEEEEGSGIGAKNKKKKKKKKVLSSQSAVSYVKVLFQTLEGLLSDSRDMETRQATIDGLPYIFRIFLKQNSQEKKIPKAVEFQFLQKLLFLLGYHSATNPGPDSSLKDQGGNGNETKETPPPSSLCGVEEIGSILACLLHVEAAADSSTSAELGIGRSAHVSLAASVEGTRALTECLQATHQYSVYEVGEDASSGGKQFTFFYSIAAQVLLSLSFHNYRCVLDCLRVVMGLNHQLLEPFLVAVLVLFHFGPKEKEAERLAEECISTYAKLRQLPVFVKKFLASLDLMMDVGCCSPCSPAVPPASPSALPPVVLSRLGDCVRTLPPGQCAEVLESLSVWLADTYLPQVRASASRARKKATPSMMLVGEGSGGVSPPPNKKVKKKEKKKKKNDKGEKEGKESSERESCSDVTTHKGAGCPEAGENESSSSSSLPLFLCSSSLQIFAEVADAVFSSLVSSEVWQQRGRGRAVGKQNSSSSSREQALGALGRLHGVLCPSLMREASRNHSLLPASMHLSFKCCELVTLLQNTVLRSEEEKEAEEKMKEEEEEDEKEEEITEGGEIEGHLLLPVPDPCCPTSLLWSEEHSVILPTCLKDMPMEDLLNPSCRYIIKQVVILHWRFGMELHGNAAAGVTEEEALNLLFNDGDCPVVSNSNWNGQVSSITEHNLAQSCWTLALSSLPLLYPRCSQSNLASTAKFLLQSLLLPPLSSPPSPSPSSSSSSPSSSSPSSLSPSTHERSGSSSVTDAALSFLRSSSFQEMRGLHEHLLQSAILHSLTGTAIKSIPKSIKDLLVFARGIDFRDPDCSFADGLSRDLLLTCGEEALGGDGGGKRLTHKKAKRRLEKWLNQISAYLAIICSIPMGSMSQELQCKALLCLLAWHSSLLFQQTTALSCCPSKLLAVLSEVQVALAWVLHSAIHHTTWRRKKKKKALSSSRRKRKRRRRERMEGEGEGQREGEGEEEGEGEGEGEGEEGEGGRERGEGLGAIVLWSYKSSKHLLSNELTSEELSLVASSLAWCEKAFEFALVCGFSSFVREFIEMVISDSSKLIKKKMKKKEKRNLSGGESSHLLFFTEELVKSVCVTIGRVISCESPTSVATTHVRVLHALVLGGVTDALTRLVVAGNRREKEGKEDEEEGAVSMSSSSLLWLVDEHPAMVSAAISVLHFHPDHLLSPSVQELFCLLLCKEHTLVRGTESIAALLGTDLDLSSSCYYQHVEHLFAVLDALSFPCLLAAASKRKAKEMMEGEEEEEGEEMEEEGEGEEGEEEEEEGEGEGEERESDKLTSRNLQVNSSLLPSPPPPCESMLLASWRRLQALLTAVVDGGAKASKTDRKEEEREREGGGEREGRSSGYWEYAELSSLLRAAAICGKRRTKGSSGIIITRPLPAAGATVDAFNDVGIGNNSGEGGGEGGGGATFLGTTVATTAATMAARHESLRAVCTKLFSVMMQVLGSAQRLEAREIFQHIFSQDPLSLSSNVAVFVACWQLVLEAHLSQDSRRELRRWLVKVLLKCQAASFVYSCQRFHASMCIQLATRLVSLPAKVGLNSRAITVSLHMCTSANLTIHEEILSLKSQPSARGLFALVGSLSQMLSAVVRHHPTVASHSVASVVLSANKLIAATVHLAQLLERDCSCYSSEESQGGTASSFEEGLMSSRKGKGDKCLLAKAAVPWKEEATKSLTLCANLVARALEAMSKQPVFSKYVAHCIIEYVNTSQKQPMNADVKGALLPGVFSLMKLCSESEMAFVQTCLNFTARETLQRLLIEYQRYYKFYGKV